MECPACGTQNPDKSNYCQECGHRLEEPVARQPAAEAGKRQYACPYCDEAVAYSARACPSCGRKLYMPDEAAQDASGLGVPASGMGPDVNPSDRKRQEALARWRARQQQEEGSAGTDRPSSTPQRGKGAQRVCEWCAELIPQQALRCPRCQKWRKDIDRERVLAYTWGIAEIAPGALLIAGLRNGWWHEFSGFLSYSFSFGSFVSSASGLFVIAGSIVTFGMFWRYYSSVSGKIGTWWWF